MSPKLLFFLFVPLVLSPVLTSRIILGPSYSVERDRTENVENMENKNANGSPATNSK
jgi:hypothetical protein